VVAKHGRLDALVHLVGGWAGGKPIAESGDEVYREMFDQNVGTVFYFMKAALAPMRKQGSGRIVAIGSRAAVEASPGAGLYGASKAALVSLVRTAAVENRDAGIRVNAILPTTMDTPVNRKFNPDADTSKWVKTGSVASLIVWLLSDAGKDVNGAAVPVLGSDV
jgi:NAD(P)-dependent dehydrogenase (short-subunit alcohol dehydrogenase family)